MNLYLLTQDEENGYDTYDSVVVAAESEDEARLIHPSDSSKDPWGENSNMGWWCESPESVTVEMIGKAKTGTLSGVVLASFNAG